MSANRKILLNPGPGTTSQRVKDSLKVDDICPRKKDFGNLIDNLRTKLTRVVSAEKTHTAVLFAGSGTAAVESCISSLMGADDKLLIIDNGAYGERAHIIAKAYGVPHKIIHYRWDAYPDVIKIEEEILKEASFTHCFFVHHETTTGMLNPLEAMLQLCRKHQLVSIVDTISSYAGIPLDLSQVPIDYLISTSSKCIQGFPGVCFVIAEKAALWKTESLPKRNFYLNLFENWKYIDEKHEFQFTPPVQVLYALSEALDEFFDEGQETRYKRYVNCYSVLLSEMKRLNFSCLIPESQHSKLLTAFFEPKDSRYQFEAMHDYLYERGITIYPGKLIEVNTFRIANIGDLYPEDIRTFIKNLETYLIESKLIVRPDCN